MIMKSRIEGFYRVLNGWLELSGLSSLNLRTLILPLHKKDSHIEILKKPDVMSFIMLKIALGKGFEIIISSLIH